MRTIQRVLLILSALLPGFALCAWTQEPNAFLGIPLGELADMPSCPKDPEFGDYNNMAGLARMAQENPALVGCIGPGERGNEFRPHDWTPGSGVYRVLVPASKGVRLFKTNLRVVFESGKPQRISATFDSGDFSRFAEMLSERYGPPHYVKDRQVRMSSGAVFPTRVMGWVGPRVVISADSFVSIDRNTFGRVEHTGEFVIETKGYGTARSQSELEHRKGEASKF